MESSPIDNRPVVVVPFFPGHRSNEHALMLLRDCIRRLRRHWRHVIVVDDGSHLVPRGDEYQRIPLCLNSGKVAATRIGVSAALVAGCTCVGIVDFDDEQRQEDLPALFEA